MSVGMVHSSPFTAFIDKLTGANITRLTPLDVCSHRNYFYQKCFTNDGSHLLLAMERTGHLNYHLLNLSEQTATQLTVGAGDNSFGGFISNDDKYLYYVKNNSNLKRLTLNSYYEELIYSSPKDWVAYGTWVANSNSTKMVGIEIHKDDYDPLHTWQAFIEMYHKKPLCRLFTLDLLTGVQEIILETKCWLGHPLFRPHHDDLLAFCHEGPHDLVDSRIWFIGADGSNLRQFKEQAKGESCTHEFWVGDGSAMIYVSYMHSDTKRYIYRIDGNTLENNLLMSMPNCSHLMSNYNGTLLVGDGADTPVDVVDSRSYQIENDPRLYIFDIKAKISKPIGLHSSSWATYKNSRQITHPHPSFSLDDKKVLYSSDFEGETAVYLLDLK